jgi:hypothetical protein
MDAIENGTLFAWSYLYARYDFFEVAAAGQFVSIIETDMLNPIPRITKLSTAGLSQAITTMRQRCNGV